MDHNAEVIDQVQQLFRVKRFNDHQLHCVLRFAAGVDTCVLKKAFIASIEAFPILGTRYIDGPRPRWNRLTSDLFNSGFIIARTEAEFEKFIVSRIDETLGPQVKIGIHKTKPFSIAVKMNHMVCDAAGLKTFLYSLCKTYSMIISDPAYRPPLIAGDRSMRKILQCFSVSAKVRALLLKDNEKNLTGEKSFPFAPTGEAQPFILTRKLKRERVSGLRNYGRARGATLNDVVLTAYYRCLFDMLALRPATKLTIPITVDMRRHLKEKKEFVPLTNFTSVAITRLHYNPHEDFQDTLRRVKAIMDEKKNNDIGLNRLITFNLVYRIFGDRRANRRLRGSLNNPLLSMTNIGVLDSAKLALGALRPCDAFLCGSIKFKPYFQLAMSSYDEELTFSVNLYGTAKDRDHIFSFFDRIEAELPHLAQC